MAEGIARHYAQRRGWAVEVRSGGVMGLVGKPADANAVRVMSEVGIDLSQHRCSGVDAEKADWADHILVMELNHSRKLRERFPQVEDKVLMLGSFGGLVDVEDPIGGWRWKFRKTRHELTRCVEGFMDRLPPAPAAD